MKRNGFRKIYLSILLVANTLFSTNYSLAQSPPDHRIDSDSVFYVTDAFLKSKAKSVLTNLLSHFELKSANQTIGSSPTIQLNQIDVTITPAKYEISDDGDGLAFIATNNMLHVNIGEVGIHETIQRNVNGVIAIIRIDVSCTGASLTITDPNSIISSQLAPGVNGNLLQINFVNPMVRLVNPTLEMSGFKCTGASGFEKLIHDTIQLALKDTKSTNEFLAQTLLSNSVLLDQNLSFNWKDPRLVFGDPKDPTAVQGWVMPNTIAVMPNEDWQSTGAFRMILPTSVEKGTPYTKFAKWPLDIKTEAGYVALPDASVIEMIRNYFAPGKWEHKDKANNFSAFAGLLKSGLEETLVWPDLKKYPKHQPFPIVVTTTSMPDVQWTSASTLSFKADFHVAMSTNNKPYANFQIATDSKMAFSVKDNQLNLQLIEPKFKVTYAWDPSYCSHHCSNIGTEVIAEGAQEFLNNAKFLFNLPPMRFAGTNVNTQSLLRDEASQAVVLQLSPK